MGAPVRNRFAVAFGAAVVMVVAAACGRTGILAEEVDLGSPDSAGDQPVGSDSGASDPTEAGVDEQVADANPTDADTHPHDASVDARTDANDARYADDARTDASDGRYANDASADAGDARPDASDAGYLVDAKDGGAVDGDAKSDAPADAFGEPCAVTKVYVDAIRGNDASDGSVAMPYKTITKAIMVAAGNTCIATIFVSSGTYDVVNGEVFPLRIPPNVALIGDEANKGLPDGGSVFIVGFGNAQPLLRATVYPSSGATIAGFEITAPLASPDPGTGYRDEVLLFAPTTGVTVRNNTIVGSDTQIINGTVGIYNRGSTDNVIVGNIVKGNTIGIYNGAGASSKVESNVVTGNWYGVEADALGADLGGGAFAGAGLNSFACNEQNLWLTAEGQPASNNYWDHVPPTVVRGVEGHADIYMAAFVVTGPITTGAMLAATNCP
jgi:parallel beta-helix repeat protein